MPTAVFPRNFKQDKISEEKAELDLSTALSRTIFFSKEAMTDRVDDKTRSTARHHVFY